MTNQNILLIVLAALVIGGVFVYIASDRWSMGPRGGNMTNEAVGEHHGGEDVLPHEIYPGAVAEKIRNSEDVILLDVRTPEEYAEVHLTNATLLPVQELSQQSLSEIGLGENAKDKEIIIYCRSGARSQTAYNIMESLGYTNIKSIAGGMVHWEEDNYPFTEAGAYEGRMMNGDGMMTNETDETEGPRIFLDRTSHDFGVVPQYGGVVETDFTVHNTGVETLEIGDITTSCSCTTARVADTSVEPGADTTLTVVFDPDFHEEPRGVFKRTVFIPTNDQQTPEAEVSITVDIAEGA